jgi:hypothetical protein
MQESKTIQQLSNMWHQQAAHSFVQLADCVRETHLLAQETAVRAVNRMATLRNWLIGSYIVEYEQNGEDRAKYGEQLLARLAESVNEKGINVTTLEQSRRFYIYYPELLRELEGTKSATALQKFKYK